jgi:hypothetical protein
VGANTNARLFLGTRKSPVKLVLGAEAVEPIAEVGPEGNDIVLPASTAFAVRTPSSTRCLRNERIRTIVLVGVSVNVAIINVTFDAVNRVREWSSPRRGDAGTPIEYVEQCSRTRSATWRRSPTPMQWWQPGPRDHVVRRSIAHGTPADQPHVRHRHR